MSRSLSVLAIALALATPALAQSPQGGANASPLQTAAPSDLLISTSQLASQLTDPAVVILHVGADRDSTFADGHIPRRPIHPLRRLCR